MNNYSYAQHPYGQMVETDDNIPKGQPMNHQIQMSNYAPQQQQQQSQMMQQQQFQVAKQQPIQQYSQQYAVYNYPQQPPQNQMNAPNMYASNIPQQNNIGYYPQNMSQQNSQHQAVYSPQQQNYGMAPVARFPTSRHPQLLFCDNCKQNNETKVTFKNGSGAYIAGGLIASCGFWLGCCLIPCMIDDCKDAEHLCTRCGYKIGSKRFLFD